MRNAMSTGVHRKSGTPGDSNVWDIPDARNRFDDLLAAAANSGPQIIRGENLHFRLSLDRASSSPKGRALLASGGPLEDDDLGGD
jgi:hypothetical protein